MISRFSFTAIVLWNVIYRYCDVFTSAFPLLSPTQGTTGRMSIHNMKYVSSSSRRQQRQRQRPSTFQLLAHDHITPIPELTGLDVVMLCMDALVSQTANDALEVCFTFSSDRCRAAVGGTLDAFVRYADNPVFGTLLNCDSYEIISLGPIIPPSSSSGLGSRRGEMQTVLVEIQEGMTLKSILRGGGGGTGGQQERGRTRKRPTIEERIQRRQMLRGEGDFQTVANDSDDDEDDDVPIVQENLGQGRRRFLWTVQKEVRPPRQHCWLVHEVLFTQNAIHQTY